VKNAKILLKSKKVRRPKVLDKKLRVAVIGLGKMGLLHAGILSVLPDVELVALCEKSARAKKTQN